MKKKYSTIISFSIIFFMMTIGFSFTTFAISAFENESNRYIADNALAHAQLKKAVKEWSEGKKRKKSDPIEAKAVYVTTYSAAGERLDKIIQQINVTELNAVVIDIKDYSGWIAYDTDVELINILGTEKIIISNLEEVLQKLKDNNIYSIARMQVFQDPILAEKKPEWAVQSKSSGGLWRDYKGLAWLDPNNEKVWEYVVLLAKDAIEKGFDEINFDYIRFPSDGPISDMVFPHDSGRTKTETINSFFTYVGNELKNEPAYRSADLFGMTMWVEDDFNIGQTLAGAAPHFDYIAPMVYPSHYPNGFLGYENPAAHPYDVIYKNLERGNSFLAKTSTTAQIRPWLQDFDLGAEYTPARVRDQINAADAWDTHGWFLWNASNNYTYAALANE